MNLNWFQKKTASDISQANRAEKLPKLITRLNDKYGNFDYSQDARMLDTKGELEAILAALIGKIPPSSQKGNHSVLITGANNGTEIPVFKGFDITVLDLSDVALKKVSEKYLGATVVHGDIQNLPFPDKSFDVYVCLRAIHASSLDMQKALQESVRVAKSFAIYSVSDGYNIEGSLVKGMYDHGQQKIDASLPSKHLDTIKTFLLQNGYGYEIFETPSEVIVFARLGKTSNGRTLDVVDESGKVIGTETRERIHREGLLHREIHVWFYTPQGELVFQHRAKDMDTYPDLLDATVGGHVEKGSDYAETALQEMLEETGVEAEIEQLSLIKTVYRKSYDATTNTTNNAISAEYTYRYDGKIEDLKIEEGKSLGFEKLSFEAIFSLSDADKKRFIPLILEDEVLSIFREIQKLV